MPNPLISKTTALFCIVRGMSQNTAPDALCPSFPSTTQDLDLCSNLLGSGGAHTASRLLSLTSLTRLALSDNALTALPEALGSRLPRLQHLLLSGNRLQALPESVWQLASLVALDVRRNRLAGLPDGVSCLVALRELHVSGERWGKQQAEAIKSRAFVAWRSAHIRIWDMAVQAQRTHAPSPATLRPLPAAGNHMAALPPALGTLTTLHMLGAGLNYFTALQPSLMLSLASSLRSLDVQHSVTVLGDAGPWLAALGTCTRLTSLCVSCNNLRVGLCVCALCAGWGGGVQAPCAGMHSMATGLCGAMACCTGRMHAAHKMGT